VKFAKMHGLGNDYIYVDVARERVDDPAALARAVSDRQRGIGADGLILIGPSTGAGVDVSMRIFNADGSEAQMCGNGIRCVAKYAIDRGLSTSNPLRVATRRGILSMLWTNGEDGKVASVEVDMGAPIFALGKIPAEIPGLGDRDEVIARPFTRADWADALSGGATARSACSLEWIDRSGLSPSISLASMGNPHAVFWARDVDAVPLEAAGSAIERHRFFPERINVHFVEAISRDEVRVRTWERGSGATMACGTGACAVCAAGVREARTDRRITARLPGGELEVAWLDAHASVLMRGPATHVFDGEWPLEVRVATGARS
jgi:diaminopimelate epimerase